MEQYSWAIIISVLILFYTNNKIVRPLKNFVEQFKEGTQGNLAIRSHIATGDELQTLSEEFNNFMIKLESIISEIKNLASKVKKDNEDLSKAMIRVVNGEEANKINGVVQLDKGYS